MLLQYGFLALLILVTWDVTQAAKPSGKKPRPWHSFCPRYAPVGSPGPPPSICSSHVNCDPPNVFCYKTPQMAKHGFGVCCPIVPDINGVCDYGDAYIPQPAGYCDTNAGCSSGPPDHYCKKHPLGRWATCCPICYAGHSVEGTPCNAVTPCTPPNYCGATGVCCAP